MEQEFAGKVAIVTGASRGIGLATARMLAARGASLVLVARDPARLDDVSAKLSGSDYRTVTGDAARREVAERAVATALDAFGRLDLLLNIAGWYPTALVAETDDANFRQTIDANLGATFAMCRAAVAALQDSRGAVVNMSSTAARFPTPGLAAYSASKAGVEALTRSFAAEMAPRVRVNAVAAGPTLTETVAALVDSDTTGAVAAVTDSLPLGRMAQVDEIAEAILFLASPRASVITGQTLYANCGGHMA